MGVSTQAYGALNQWLIQVINIATGNLDKEGGSLFTLPALDTISTGSPGGFGRHHSRVRGLPEFDRELPASTMAEEITTPGDGQIRALFTGAATGTVDTQWTPVDERWSNWTLWFAGPYINETTRHADIFCRHPPGARSRRHAFNQCSAQHGAATTVR